MYYVINIPGRRFLSGAVARLVVCSWSLTTVAAAALSPQLRLSVLLFVVHD